jgi:tetratricopeptide (TPR) repeat protein
MKTLKRLVFTVLLVFIAGLWQIKAQNPSALQTAFDQSYMFETSAQYAKAAEIIKTVYSEKSYEINLRLGWLIYKNGSYLEAASYYLKAINLMPNAIEARLGYVLPESAMGNYDKVIEQYTEILKIDPKNASVNYNMGLIYYNRSDFKTAYKYLEIAAGMYLFDYDITLYFAWTNLKLEKYPEAKELFNRVLLISPNDASATEGLKLIK